jgi:glutamate-1-semialdehyde 2,1-aminomutase
MGYGPAILGYADPRVDQAAREGMQVGGVFALSTECEFRVAERIAKMVPAAQLVRFSNSGTEAVMAALRLARAFTGKDDYVILEGSYHGLFDAAMWYTPMDKWSQVGEPEVYPYSEGVPLSTRNFAHFVQANDANQLEDVFKRHAGSIACLLIEPIMGNCLGIATDPAYIRAARELCDRHGVVLIIDEVKSGFRVARGGVQELYGVQADLCTFAKAIANGYPISVLAGREDIMRKIGRGVAHGGTYTAHPVSLAAAERTLQILDETDALERIAAYGTRLRSGMSAILKARGVAHSFVGHPSMGGLYFAHEPPRTYRDWKGSDYTFYDAAARVLHDERILCEPDSREPWFICAAHDDSCLRDTLAGFEVAIDTTLETLGKSRKMPA